MFSKNSRVLIIAMMVLLYAGQSVASAVSVSMVADSHIPVKTLLSDSSGSRSDPRLDSKPNKAVCHQADNEFDQKVTLNNELNTSSGEAAHCCDIECHCPLGMCVSVALPVQSMVGGQQASAIAQNSPQFQWLVSQSPSSLYRPPITL